MPLRPSPQGVQEASRSPHQCVAISIHRTTMLLQALSGLSGHNIEHTQKKEGTVGMQPVKASATTAADT